MSRTAVVALFRLFARREEPYAGADMELAKRIGALIWAITATIALAVTPLAPPTAQFGEPGWLLFGAIVAAALAMANGLFYHRPRVSNRELLAKSYLGLVLIGLLQWLSGGEGSPFQSLYLIWVMYVAAIHPPRLALVFVLVASLASSSFLLYEGGDTVAGADLGVRMLIWLSLAVMTMLWTQSARAQRLGLHMEGEKAKQLARIDPLTGLGNRRAFDEALDAEIARSRRQGTAVSVAVADLDDFKQINDRYGHLVGDQCLRQAASALREAGRTMDSCFRWGGDEFAFILPETDDTGAERACDRLRAAVTSSCIKPDGDPLTMSCGHAELKEGLMPADLLAMADARLLALKGKRGPRTRADATDWPIGDSSTWPAAAAGDTADFSESEPTRLR